MTQISRTGLFLQSSLYLKFFFGIHLQCAQSKFSKVNMWVSPDKGVHLGL